MTKALTVSLSNDYLNLHWPDKNRESFPFSWLRDNCQCPLCFHQDSKARLFLLKDLDVNIEAQQAYFDHENEMVRTFGFYWTLMLSINCSLAGSCHMAWWSPKWVPAVLVDAKSFQQRKCHQPESYLQENEAYYMGLRNETRDTKVQLQWSIKQWRYALKLASAYVDVVTQQTMTALWVVSNFRTGDERSDNCQWGTRLSNT